jgi:RecB family endonuclease NucS
VPALTPEQRAEIIALIAEGLSTREIAERVSVSPRQVAAIRAHVSRGTYIGGTEGEEVKDAFETTFGLERDLQEALRKNIEQLESGLTIVDGGKEHIVESGRIDITALDQSGTKVVI